MVIVETKLHIPRMRTEQIARPYLMGKLKAGLDCKLTLVTAPPGYGKTTILGEWTKDSSIPVAWVSLDLGDNNWHRFWTHLIAALKQAAPLFDSAYVNNFVGSDDIEESLTAAMVNGLNRLSEQIIIIWDDFHYIENPTILNGVSYLLKRLPAHIHLFIAARVQPSLPLSKMHTSGELNLVGVDDLRFSQEESINFFNNIKEREWSFQEMSHVLERTEGWVTGMWLAALSSNEKKEHNVLVKDMSGRQREIANYFFEEVLSNQPADMQQFLLQTSILGRMNAELCEAVTGMENSRVYLQHLELNNLFITPLDSKQEWYRYHHLFQDFLVMHAKTHHNKQLEALHIKAARWLEEKGLVREAMPHYLQSENYEEALRLLEKVSPEFMRHERATLRAWVDAIPDHLLISKPKLFMMNVASLFLIGQTKKGKDKLAWAMNNVEEMSGPLSPSAVNNFEAGLSLLEFLKTYFERDFTASIQHSKEFLKRNPEGHFFVGDAMVQDGYHPMWEVYIVIGNLPLAEKVIQEYLAVWSKSKNDLLVAIFQLAYGRLLYEWNRLEEAEHYMQKARDVAVMHNHLNMTVLVTLWIARIHLANGRTDAAEFELLTWTEQVNPHEYPNLSQKIDYTRAQLQVRVGEIEKALEWSAMNDFRAVDEIPLSLIDEYDLFACLLAKQQRTEEAVTLIDRLLRIARRERWQSDIIRLLTHKSIILAEQGKVIQSLNVLEEALHLGEPEGYIRTFLDEGKRFMELLQHYLDTRQKQHRPPKNNVSIAYVKQLLQLGSIIYTNTVAIRAKSLVEPLTPQETKILQLINADLTNKEITEKMDISHSTVKTHINNMYRKLQVENRMQALHRAKQLGIL